MKGCDLVYVPLSTPPQRLEELLNQEVNLAVHMPGACSAGRMRSAASLPKRRRSA